jgi:hypothetical protein
MQFVIDQCSLASLPPYWYPVMPSAISPYLSLSLPPFLQWPSIHVHYTEAHLPVGVDPNPELPIESAAGALAPISTIGIAVRGDKLHRHIVGKPAGPGVRISRMVNSWQTNPCLSLCRFPKSR